MGISSGGVAEVFETNSKDGTETIILSNRKGLVKLALRHGADIVPCFLYGNTAALSVWYDPFGVMRAISRKVREGRGRWGSGVGRPGVGRANRWDLPGHRAVHWP